MAMATLAVMAATCTAQTYVIQGDYDYWFGPPEPNGVWHTPGSCENWQAECEWINANDPDCADCKRACRGDLDCPWCAEHCGDIGRTDCERRRDRCYEYCEARGYGDCSGVTFEDGRGGEVGMCTYFYDDCVKLHNEVVLGIEPNYQYCVDKVLALSEPDVWHNEQCCKEIASETVNDGCVDNNLPVTCDKACHPPPPQCGDDECYECADDGKACAWPPEADCDAECDDCRETCHEYFGQHVSSGKVAPVKIQPPDLQLPTKPMVATTATYGAGALTAVGGVIVVLLACIAGLLCFAICVRPLFENYQKKKMPIQ